MSEMTIVGAAPSADHRDFYRALLSRARGLIAADAAGEWCVELGRVPDLTVGDFDSAGEGAVERLRSAGSRILELPCEKDRSDLDACLDEARTLGATSVVFTAAFAARIDHTLAALGTVMRAAELGARIEEPAWWAEALTPGRGPLRLHLGKGTLFTILAPAGASGVSVSCARFPLIGAALEPLSSLGLSNISTGGDVTIAVEEGTLLVVVQR
jgi:thiamine pyrophosphokinase